MLRVRLRISEVWRKYVRMDQSGDAEPGQYGGHDREVGISPPQAFEDTLQIPRGPAAPRVNLWIGVGMDSVSVDRALKVMTAAASVVLAGAQVSQTHACASERMPMHGSLTVDPGVACSAWHTRPMHTYQACSRPGCRRRVYAQSDPLNCLTCRRCRASPPATAGSSRRLDVVKPMPQRCPTQSGAPRIKTLRPGSLPSTFVPSAVNARRPKLVLSYSQYPLPLPPPLRLPRPLPLHRSKSRS